MSSQHDARKLSSLYDTPLSSEDLTITQYSLRANIERAGQLTHLVLAEKVGMDRTTLTPEARSVCIGSGYHTNGMRR